MSNLSFISKLLQRIIGSQLVQYTTNTGNVQLLQSAYTKDHSTETALLKVKTDIMNTVDNKEVTCLVMLDLSAAFNMLSHSLMLNRLHTALAYKDQLYHGWNLTLKIIPNKLSLMILTDHRWDQLTWPWPMGNHKEMYLDQFCSTYTPHHWVILLEIIGYSFMHMPMTNKSISASNLPSRVQK